MGEAEVKQENTLYRYLYQIAEKNSSQVAIYYLGKPITYSALISMVDSFAFNLKSLDVDGDVGIMLRNSPQILISILALNRLGLPAFILNQYENPSKYGIKTIIGNASSLCRLDPFPDRAIVVREEDLGPYGSSIDPYFKNDRACFKKFLAKRGILKFSDMIFDKVNREELPENDGVLKRHTFRGDSVYTYPSSFIYEAANSLQQFLEGYRKDVAVYSSLNHISSLIFSLIPLFSGRTLTLMPEFYEVEKTIKAIEKAESSMLVGNTYLYEEMLLKNVEMPKTIRYLFSIGEYIRPEFLKDFFVKYGKDIKIGYDISAATGLVCMQELMKNDFDSVGVALPDCTVSISDRSGKPLPVGENGLVKIKSNRIVDKTDEGGSLSTGDLGHIDESGHLYLAKASETVFGSVVSPEIIEGIIGKVWNKTDLAVGLYKTRSSYRLEAFIASSDRSDAVKFARTCKEILPLEIRPFRYVMVKKIPRSQSGKIIRELLGKESIGSINPK
ncbi:AMP-binding protein [Thermoplasma volcanium]|nr:class I adenylate-forming enzyme family protein [Thermoplasma volcanium]